MAETRYRTDDRGRPRGLDWGFHAAPTPAGASEAASGPKEAPVTKGVFTGTRWEGGRERQKFCNSGRHLMSEHGVELKDGGRYCRPCKTEYAREYQRAWRRRMKEERLAAEREAEAA